MAGRVESVELLLGAGAKVNQQNKVNIIPFVKPGLGHGAIITIIRDSKGDCMLCPYNRT